MEINVTKTNRGFDLLEFRDHYDAECSLQKSSLATDDAIWFGPNNPNPDCFHMTTRMHLTRDQVKMLLPFLHRFVETGELTEEAERG